MTKLSLVFDHDMRCWMLWSSSMLCEYQCRSSMRAWSRGLNALVQLVYECRLNDLGLLGRCGSADCSRRTAIWRGVSRVSIRAPLLVYGAAALCACAVEGGRSH